MFLNYWKLMTVIMLMMVVVMMNQPMVMAVLLFSIALLYSMNLFYLTMEFWYGAILMLVILSGVLVIFTYMASMTPNEKFEVSLEVVGITMLMGWMIMKELWSFEESVGSLKLWNGMIMIMNLFMVVYLLVMMLMVIWMSNWWIGSMRVYWKELLVGMM